MPRNTNSQRNSVVRFFLVLILILIAAAAYVVSLCIGLVRQEPEPLFPGEAVSPLSTADTLPSADPTVPAPLPTTEPSSIPETAASFQETTEALQEAVTGAAQDALYFEAVTLTENGTYAEADRIFRQLWSDGMELFDDPYWRLCETKLLPGDEAYQELTRILGFDILNQYGDTVDYGYLSSSDGSPWSQSELIIHFKDAHLTEQEYTFEMGDGSRIRVPATFGEYYDAGWRVYHVDEGVTEYGLDLKNAELTDLVPEYGGGCTLINGNGKVLDVFITYHHQEPAALKDIPVDICSFGLDVYPEGSEGSEKKPLEAESFRLNGITEGTAAADIIGKLGFPTQICYTSNSYGLQVLEFIYYETNGSTGHSMYLYLDSETGALDRISWVYS